MPYLIGLFEEPAASADVIGNKAAGLNELHRAGFRVPRGLCVTTAAYRAWREAGAISAVLREQIVTAFRQLSAPVAVRSSSPAEDRADASFAGQYVTVLGVRTENELIDALEQCFRSASSSASSTYRRDQGAEADVDMAVLIQELVPASAAGVLFTMNPITDRVDQVVVNANFGLGESVVSGTAEPDTFILDKRSGAQIEARLGSKRIATRQQKSGVAHEPLDEKSRAAYSLSAPQLQQLAQAARKLEQRYDFPIDAEWAFEGDVLHLLQARPVTTGAAAYFTDQLDDWARERDLLDDANAVWARGSVLSGLQVSPLYYSEMSAFFADMFARIARLYGAPPGQRKIFRYIDGFTYTDATFFSTADPTGTVTPASFLSPAWRANFSIGLRHPRSLAFWANIDYYYDKWNNEWWPGVEARRPDLRSADPAAIREFIEYIEVQRRERSIVAGLAVGYAPHFLNLLAHYVEKWAPDASSDTIGVLTSGLPDSLTHAENVDLWELAQSARTSPEVVAALLAGEFESLPGRSGGKQFLERVDAFRRKRPHRGCSDRDIYQSRWGDDRGSLLKQAALMLGLGDAANPGIAHARTAARRKQVEADVLAKVDKGLFGSLKRRIFEWVLRSTQRYVMHRDNQRHTFEPYFFELRCAYRAIGARFVAQGLLTQPDDVFFLGKNEIYACIDGKLPGVHLRTRAAWRREWWHRVTRKEPPAFMQGNQVYQPEAAGAAVDSDLTGAPGAPGIVTGPVRLIASLHELNRVQPGDILVTHAIDPAWTPVFGTIGGVISVEGGMLAHAAVLGREYGLPVVVGAAGATTRLQDGDMVKINGTSGAIWIERKAEPDSAQSDSTQVDSMNDELQGEK